MDFTMTMSMMDIASQGVNSYNIFFSNYHNKIVTGENQGEDIIARERLPVNIFRTHKRDTCLYVRNMVKYYREVLT